MRLAYLDPHAVPGRVPEAMQILQTVDAFGAIGIDVTLAAPEPAAGTTPELILGRALSPRVRFERILTARDRILGLGRSKRPFYRRAARWLADQRCDAVLVRNLKLAEHLLAHAPRAPIFFETHEVFAQTFREEHARLRWREPELMEALREAVLELGLAPVILWQRFQRQIPMLPMGSPTVLVVNLWERA